MRVQGRREADQKERMVNPGARSDCRDGNSLLRGRNNEETELGGLRWPQSASNFVPQITIGPEVF